jgi:hypothetical protein
MNMLSVIAASKRRVAAPADISVAYLTTLASSIINNTSQTFSAVSLGAANADRHIIIVSSNNHGFGNGGVIGVKIGGASCTMDITAQSSNRRHAAVARLAVPTGTSADIEITTNGPIQNVRASVFSVIKNGLSLVGTTSAVQQTSPVSASRAVTAGGVVFLTASTGTTATVLSPAIASTAIASSFSGDNQYHGFALTPTTKTETIDIAAEQVITYGIASYV